MKSMHSFKRFIQRIVIQSKREKMKGRNFVKGDFEVETLKICRNLIHLPETTLLVCPDSDRRFIICDKQQIKIVIYDDRIIISNHAYYYELPVSSLGISRILRVFDGNVRGRRNILEADIKSNAKTTLNNIITNTNF